MEKTILITGGLGFIGSALVYHFNKLGRKDIVICDRFRKGDKWKNIRDLLVKDIVDPDEVFNYLAKKPVKTIYHLGACSDTREVDMDFLYRNNFLFSKKLFELALERNVNFIYASSAATYGNEETCFSENKALDRLAPINQYGFSKQLFDKWVFDHLGLWREKIKRDSPLILAGVKFFNVFGPQEYHKGRMASVVYHGFKQAKAEGAIHLFRSYRPAIKDGEQKRDFVYIKDVCRALAFIEENPFWNQKRLIEDELFIYNLGSGKAHSFNELAGAVFKAMEVSPKVSYIPMEKELIPRYQYFTKAEMNWATDLTYLRKEDYLELAVRDYVRNYLMKENLYFSHYAQDEYA